MNYLRDEVFIAGGQPTVTYVDRADEEVERNFARAVATPNQIVSLSGPSKTGKTVLCRKILNGRDYVWVDGGRVQSIEGFWDFICSEFNVPKEYQIQRGGESGNELGITTPLITASGSNLTNYASTETHQIDGPGSALSTMVSDKIILVVDDFHYIDSQIRKEIVRNVKGAVFNGLKIVLLSVTHRAFDAIKDENELTGRFIAVNLPEWNADDLKKIPEQGFKALGVICSHKIIDTLCSEAQANPFLMQKFCWEICFDMGIEDTRRSSGMKIHDIELNPLFIRLAKDAGLPIYQKLSAGPQSRKKRARRPLSEGGDVDIYEATLRAIAETGPKPTIKYDEIRAALGTILQDMIPQKHEVTSALKHLTNISREINADSAIDWDEDSREVTVADPYLRFYLRWQIKRD